MNKFTLILAAAMLVALVAADSARADHRSRGNCYGNNRYSYGFRGPQPNYSFYGSPRWNSGFGGYIGSPNVYRSYSNPYGLYGNRGYGYGCNPYGNSIGINRGGFGLYFRF